ncbi:hypothetical protein [Kaarinaea lacus]
MNRIWYQYVGHILLCSALISVNNIAIAQQTESVTGNASAEVKEGEEPLKSGTAKPDDISTQAAKHDAGDDKVENKDSDKKLVEEDKTLQEIKTSVLQVKVFQLGGDNLPIKDARVIVTLDNAKELEYKTDDTGVALLTGLPYGKVDIDVTSSGRQSGGGTVTLDEPEETMTFHLKPRSFSNQ